MSLSIFIYLSSWTLTNRAISLSAHRSEAVNIRKTRYLEALNASISFMAIRVTMFSCLAVYVLLGNLLTPEALFVTAALVLTLRVGLMSFFPKAVEAAAELSVTCKRIQVAYLVQAQIDEINLLSFGALQNFLLLEEMPTNAAVAFTNSNNNNNNESYASMPIELSQNYFDRYHLKVENITASWDNVSGMRLFVSLLLTSC